MKLTGKSKGLIALTVITIILISFFSLLVLNGNVKLNFITIPPNNSNSTSPASSYNNGSVSQSPGTMQSPTTSYSPSPSVSQHNQSQQTTNASSPSPSSTTPPNTGANTSLWTGIAATAWRFFQPGVGVDPTTGLPYAGGTNFEAFTDWDLGAYIEAVIAAQKIGLINADGTWGANYRLDKVLTFLEDRPLNTTTGWPFWFYDATNGQGYEINGIYSSDGVNVADTGKLLIALYDVIEYDPSYTQAIDNLIFNVNGNRSNYASLIPSIQNTAYSNNIYVYYYDCGFALFWPQQLNDVTSQVLNNIVDSKSINTYGVTLPDVPLNCEPLLFSIFELKSDSALTNLMNEAYQAQVAYYDVTRQYVAFSEGQSPFNGYVYEWIVGPNGEAWQITDADYSGLNMNPVIFTKVAYSFLALYDSTYALNMVNYLQKTLPSPSNGYFDGVDTAGNLDAVSPGSETNSLILEAAVYALQR